MKHLRLSLLLVAACGASPAPQSATPVAVPAASFAADLDMMCAAPTEASFQSAPAEDKMRVLAQHIEANVTTDDGRDLFEALRSSADKRGLIVAARSEAGHAGECPLEDLLAELATSEAAEGTSEEVAVEEAPTESSDADSSGAEVSDPVVTGALSREQIQSVIRAHLNEVRYCYERRLVQDPTLAGTTVIRFTINAEGRVAASGVASGFDDTVDRCVARQVGRWTFPEPAGGGIVVVRYPFVFQPG